MASERGFTLMELVIVVAVIGIMAAIAIPGVQAAVSRNKLITTAELVGAQIRGARLAAITRNATFRVRFDCEGGRAVRMVVITGTAVDDAADRCQLNQPNDGPLVMLPPGIGFGVGDDMPTAVEINGRGQISSIGGAMPQTLSVTYGEATRNIIITATGRVRTPTS